MQISKCKNAKSFDSLNDLRELKPRRSGHQDVAIVTSSWIAISKIFDFQVFPPRRVGHIDQKRKFIG